ncbi:MAG: PAS domain-containing protein [Desulfobacterales bacterium]|nr:MAG: PAS domain-containing protein [Desulfobacterales bacterium]
MSQRLQNELARHQRKEKELREASIQLQTLIHAIPDVVYFKDIEGRTQVVNRAFQNMFGLEMDQIVGKTDKELLPPQMAEKCLQGDKETIEAGKSLRFIEQIEGEAGTDLFFETIKAPIYNDQGDLLGLVGVSRDITRSKNVEKELQVAKEAAEAASQAKSEFLSSVSHELRTPLNHILGFTEIILDQHFGTLNAVQEEYLGDVHQSSQHLLSLINDILDLSKMEAGKQELKLSEVKLGSLLENCLAMFKEKAMKQHLKITADLEASPAVITADSRKLKQIVYNLLSNAVKFTPDNGWVHLQAVRIPQDDLTAYGVADARGRDFVRVSVQDSGIGLKKENLESIFEPFVQAESSAGRNHQGTDLGLSLTRGLIELHNGKIWAESQGEGLGSKFSFLIPLEH